MTDSYIPRAQLIRLEHAVAPGKVVVVYGPRRVGKTTLIRRYVQRHAPDAVVVTGTSRCANTWKVSPWRG